MELKSFEEFINESEVNEGVTPQYRKLISRAKELGLETVEELDDLILDEFDNENNPITGADYETAKKELKLYANENSIPYMLVSDKSKKTRVVRADFMDNPDNRKDFRVIDQGTREEMVSLNIRKTNEKKNKKSFSVDSYSDKKLPLRSNLPKEVKDYINNHQSEYINALHIPHAYKYDRNLWNYDTEAVVNTRYCEKFGYKFDIVNGWIKK